MMVSIETYPPPPPPAGSHFQRRSGPSPLQQALGGEAKQNGEVSVRWEGEGSGRARRRTTSPFSASRKQLLLNVPQEEEQETKQRTHKKPRAQAPPTRLDYLVYLYCFFFLFYSQR